MSPEGDPDIRGWRLREPRLRLIGECCPHCDKKIFPPRDICPGCGDKTTTEFQFGGKGTVYSFSTVYEAPAGYEDLAPYTIAWVILDEGPMVTARLTDLGDEEPYIGMPVENATRIWKKEGERGPITYGFSFRPILERQSRQP